MRPLIDAWRSATSRLILIYGALFAIWCVVLLGVVQWESSRYLSNVVDGMLAATAAAGIEHHPGLSRRRDQRPVRRTKVPEVVSSVKTEERRLAWGITADDLPLVATPSSLYIGDESLPWTQVDGVQIGADNA